MMRPPDMALMRHELAGYIRSPLPRRFLLLLPAGIFLVVWTWHVASPFAAVIWMVVAGLEPRFNNIFYHTSTELEALSLFPADWRRIVLVKNFSTLLIGAFAFLTVSVVLLWFSPEVHLSGSLREAFLWLLTVTFPLLSLGNDASVRYPRRDAGPPHEGLLDAAWISLTLLAVSVPYFLITRLVELPWLCIPYAAATAADWYFRSVARTATLITNQRHDIWTKAKTPSNS